MDLGRAERLVKKGEEVVARQKMLVRYFRARGLDDEPAVQLLEELESTLCDMRDYRDEVRASVASRRPILQ
jgi:hypothetical protein